MVQKVAFGSAKACLLEAERSCVGNKTAAFSLFRGFFQYFKLPLQHITDTMDIKDILKKLHVEKLNDMQNKAADAIMNTEKDVLILSATGSGTPWKSYSLSAKGLSLTSSSPVLIRPVTIWP